MASCPSAGEYSWVTKPVDRQGQSLDGGCDRVKIRVQFDWIRVLSLVDRQTRRQDLRRLESGIDVEQLDEAPHQQSRSDKQNE